MTTAVEPRPRAATIRDARSSQQIADVFVIFGLTGDVPVHPYAKGSSGPPEAEPVAAGHGRWHEPWVPA